MEGLPNLELWCQKKFYKLPKLGGGGEVIRTMPEIMHFFPQETAPKSKQHCKVSDVPGHTIIWLGSHGNFSLSGWMHWARVANRGSQERIRMFLLPKGLWLHWIYSKLFTLDMKYSIYIPVWVLLHHQSTKLHFVLESLRTTEKSQVTVEQGPAERMIKVKRFCLHWISQKICFLTFFTLRNSINLSSLLPLHLIQLRIQSFFFFKFSAHKNRLT